MEVGLPSALAVWLSSRFCVGYEQAPQTMNDEKINSLPSTVARLAQMSAIAFRIDYSASHRSKISILGLVP